MGGKAAFLGVAFPACRRQSKWTENLGTWSLTGLEKKKKKGAGLLNFEMKPFEAVTQSPGLSKSSNSGPKALLKYLALRVLYQ